MKQFGQSQESKNHGAGTSGPIKTPNPNQRHGKFIIVF